MKEAQSRYAAVAAGKYVPGKVVVKPRVNLKGRNPALDNFNQFPRVVHTRNCVLQSHDIRMHQNQLQNGFHRNAVTGIVREIVDINRPVNFLCQAVVILQWIWGIGLR